ncbi:MAG TPA: glycosyltransferase family 39 protein, partial [Anaerolineae bacterium]|nr:glycosyltransferase family 39 protein [Anaerolineae bacterium]
VAARLLAVLIMGNQIQTLPGIDDQRSYDMLAQQVVTGHGFTVVTDWWPLTRAGQPTAHWSYLYTLYLAFTYMIFGVQPIVARLLQAIIAGLFMPWLNFRLGRRLANDRVGLMAAAWSAIYGYFVYYSAALMTEMFYITAILWSLDLALSMANNDRSIKRWAVLGLSMGITALLRQTFLLIIPIVLIAALGLRVSDFKLKTAQSKLTAGLKGSIVALMVMAALILPWTLRNYQAFNRFVLLNTNAGFAFFWSNHPIYGTEFVGILPRGTSYQSLIPPELRTLDEASLDAELMKAGINFVVQDPGRYALLSLSRFKTYFEFWPTSESELLSNVVRVLSFGAALPFMLYGLILALRHWRQWLLLYVFAIVYSLIHLLSWALIRYRLPVDAVLIIFAAYGLVDLIERSAPRLKLKPPNLA